MREEWRNVKGFEGLYIISSEGRIFSIKSNKMMKSYGGDENYNHLNLTKDGEVGSYYVHRLVAEAFIPNPYHLPEVNHKDGHKGNNKVENLEWITRSDNMLHCWKVLHPGKSNSSKPVRGTLLADPSIVVEFESATQACDYLGVDRSAISQAIKRNGSSAGYKWEYYNPNEVNGDDKDERIN